LRFATLPGSLAAEKFMTALRKPDRMTVAQFHDWQPDRHPDWRWQLVDGTPVCMAPVRMVPGRRRLIPSARMPTSF